MDNSNTKSETLRTLRREKNILQNRLDAAQYENIILDKKIYRLKCASNNIEKIKFELHKYEINEKRVINKDYRWEGNKKKKFDEKGKELLEYDKNYFDEIDSILLEIKREIIRLEAKKWTDIFFKNIRKQINSIYNSINSVLDDI